jgi:HSP20 family molecular chaperone IbpA
LLQSSFSKICYRIFWIAFFERHAKIFDTLTRSMQELTRYADHISRALAEPKHKDKTAITTKDQHNLTVNEAHGLHLPLRPRIEWRETSDGFALTAMTPGLRKEELKVEVLDFSGESFVEVSGQSATTAASPNKDADSANQDAKPLELCATYRSFSERVRLPKGVDKEAMRATYENGLLVVTIPRVKTENMKRQKITIN